MGSGGHNGDLNDKEYVEIACGHGRMSAQLFRHFKVKQAIFVDINFENILKIPFILPSYSTL